MRVGEVTNDGPSGTDYAAGMNAALKAARARGTASGGNVLFQNGRVTAAADFDQAYQNVAPGSVSGAGAVWTVRDGDTLQGIAAAVWGDASLWYLIADQNGLTSASTLIAGQTLTLPAKVANVGNTSDTFRPYDPNKALGDLSPTQVKPPKQGSGGCGGTGQIIAIIIAVAVAAIVAPYAAAALANLGGGATVAAGASFAGTAAGGTIAAGSVTAAGIASGALTVSAGVGFAAGAIAGAAASIASQAFSLATGMQDRFDWKGLALSAISGGIGGGMSLTGGSLSGNGFGVGAARGAINSTITQGIGVATGLQDNFSWTSVAVSAVVSGVSSGVAANLPNAGAPAFSAQGMANSLVSGGAGAFAGAATRSVLTGTNFGDNLIAVLPDVIGATIGNAIAGGIADAQARPEKERQAREYAENAYAAEIDILSQDVDAFVDRVKNFSRNYMEENFGLYPGTPAEARADLAARAAAGLDVAAPLNGGRWVQPNGAPLTEASNKRTVLRSINVENTGTGWAATGLPGANIVINRDETSDYRLTYRPTKTDVIYNLVDQKTKEVGPDFTVSYDQVHEWKDASVTFEQTVFVSSNAAVAQYGRWMGVSTALSPERAAIVDAEQFRFHNYTRVEAEKVIRPLGVIFLVATGAAIAVPVAAAAAPVYAAAQSGVINTSIQWAAALGSRLPLVQTLGTAGAEILANAPLAAPLAVAGARAAPEIIENAAPIAERVIARLGRSGGTSPYTTNGELVQSIATRADNWGLRAGLGNGPVAGTLKHGYADRLLTRYQRIVGDRGLTAEARYAGGGLWETGMTTTGSIRLDVVEGPLANPTYVWDYKFGQATLSQSRITQIQNSIPNGANVPILMVRP